MKSASGCALNAGKCACGRLSVLVPVRMSPVPSPRRINDRPDLRVGGLPAELALGLSGVGDQGRRITGSRAGDLGGNRMTRDLSAGGDNLADARPPSGSQVKLQLLPTLEAKKRS